jgi:hypothetical protein
LDKEIKKLAEKIDKSKPGVSPSRARLNSALDIHQSASLSDLNEAKVTKVLDELERKLMDEIFKLRINIKPPV